MIQLFGPEDPGAAQLVRLQVEGVRCVKHKANGKLVGKFKSHPLSPLSQLRWIRCGNQFWIIEMPEKYRRLRHLEVYERIQIELSAISKHMGTQAICKLEPYRDRCLQPTFKPLKVSNERQVFELRIKGVHCPLILKYFKIFGI